MNTGRFAPSRALGPAEVQLVTRLREFPHGPVPDQQFKQDLRAQLVAITARVVTESAQDERTLRDVRAKAAPHRLRRPLLSLTGAAAAMLMLLGSAVWLSHGSLPGQSLYGVKRASEDARLSATANGPDKGIRYLQLATTRAGEVRQLLGMASATGVSASGISAHTATLVTDTLNTADSESRSGMRLLGSAVLTAHSAAPLTKLGPWTADQQARLAAVLTRVPTGALHDRVQSSWNLVQRIADRDTQLSKLAGCACLTAAHADDLGPLPCSQCAVPATGSAIPSGSASPTPSSARSLQTIPGRTIPGRTIPGQTIPGQTLPGQVIPGRTVPGQVIPGRTVPGQVIPGRTVPAQTVAGQPTAGHTPSGVAPSSAPAPGGAANPVTTPVLPSAGASLSVAPLPGVGVGVSTGPGGITITLPGVGIGIGPGGLSVSAGHP